MKNSKNSLFIVVTLALFFTLPLASAGLVGNISVEEVGESLSSTTSSSARAGMQFLTHDTKLKLSNVTKRTSGTAATVAYLTNSSKGVLATANFSGDIAIFEDYVLEERTTYYILADREGASYTITLTNPGVTYPKERTYINYTGSVNNLGNDDPDGAFNFFNITVSTFENFINYNQSAFQSFSEGFVMNLTTDSGENYTADLIWNGTRYNTTKSGNDSNMEFNTSFVIPTGLAGSINFYFEINSTEGLVNSSIKLQEISKVQLGLCNSTLTNTYLNLTFADEETLLSLNSTMEVTNWQYWAGTNSSNFNLLTFQNTSENPSYGFCTSPTFTGTISSTETSFRYSASGYPQRIFTTAADLTNDTTEKLLYLLANADGQYTTITTINPYGTPIDSVLITVERQFSGTYETIGQDETDASGGVTFWVSPDYDHRWTLSKDGFATQILVFRPTQSTYTILMSDLNATAAQYTSLSDGVAYAINPQPGILLNESQNYAFTFEVESSTSNLVSYTINVTNFDGDLIWNATGTNPDGSTLSNTIFTGENKSFIATYFIDTTGNLSGQIYRNEWKVLNQVMSNNSLMNGIQNWNIDNQPTDEQFGYYWYFFLILFLIVGAATKFSGAEITTPGVALIMVGSFVIGMSVFGFFTLTFSTNDFMNQYGVALCSTCLVVGRLLGEYTKN